MQAVILAAGLSSRIYPYNSAHKSLISIAGDPIIVHTLKAIKRSGINSVVIVTGANNLFEPLLGNGKKLGLKIVYVAQEKPTGMGDALLAAAHLIEDDFFVLHGHHIDFADLKEEIDKKRGTNKNVVLLAKIQDKLSDFGVIKVDGDRVLKFAEKPESGKELSRLKVIGVYFLNSEYLKTLKSTPSDHYSFEAALDSHAQKDLVRVAITNKETVSLKYPWNLLSLKDFLFKSLRRHISKNSEVSKFAQIIGNVVIEDGARVFENAVIKGPAFIGKNVVVGTNALIRDGANLEENVKIGAYMEIKNSIVMKNATSHSGLIEDTVVGSNSKIGALFATANTRLDRQNVSSIVSEKKVDTGFRHLGAIIGEDVVMGERVSTMPGVIIGNNVNIGPSTTVMKNVDSDTLYYTKFAEIIEKKKSASETSTINKKPAESKDS